MTISAPYSRVLASLIVGASDGMTITAGTPSACAAAATPCAWLPDDHATTPLRQPAASSWARALKAPRNLNEPVRCSGSALTSRRPPSRALTAGDSRSGVTTACPASRPAAARIAAISGSEAGDEAIEDFLYRRLVERRDMADVRDGHRQ